MLKCYLIISLLHVCIVDTQGILGIVIVFTPLVSPSHPRSVVRCLVYSKQLGHGLGPGHADYV